MSEITLRRRHTNPFVADAKLRLRRKTRRPGQSNVRRHRTKARVRHPELRLRRPEFHLPKMKLLHREMKTVRGDLENSEQLLRKKENRPSRRTKRDLVTLTIW